MSFRPAVRRQAARALAVLLAATALTAGWSAPAPAVTTGNGALVYSPPPGGPFDPAGTTYAKVVVLKHNGAFNGQALVTYDQLVFVGGVQVYPIYRSTDGGTSWSLVANVVPSQDFPGESLTSQPYLYEVPQQVGGLAAGTILLGGMIMPADRSSSRIVVYRSTDRGATWSLLSTIDTGGPAFYDPSPSSTTTTVWEPSFNLDASGNLVVYYSDERQKASGVLQAVVYRRSADGGLTWGPVTNVTAIGNQSDRPGMITVTRLPDGRYLATYEVVNRPSLSLDTAVVYYKYSPDGVTWNAGDLGTPVRLANGRGIGSSPFVRWVPAGGPNGMVIVASMWGLTSGGQISGGQNFFVNYHLGEGPWERLPYAVTFDGTFTQGGNFSGFAQGFDASPDGLTLYHATNPENLATGHNDIRVGTIPLAAHYYEAERATVSNAQLINHFDASNGAKVGFINFSDSFVEFAVRVPSAGAYTVLPRYTNGTGATSAHAVTVNGSPAGSVSYPPTVDWARYQWGQLTANLNAGTNAIRFTYSGTFAELDQIAVYRPGVTLAAEVRLVNRSSGKHLEILNQSTADGAGAGQWADTGHPAQVWQVTPTSGGFFQLANRNSGKLLEIPSGSLADGTQAGQWGPTGHPTQEWAFVAASAGHYQLPNRNSGKLLEIFQNSQADGAIATQWGPTGCLCQQWRLVKEGIQ